MLNPVQARQVFETTGGLVEGHFEFASGQHATRKVEAEMAMASVDALLSLVEPIAHNFRDHKIEAVVGPATGGNTVAIGVAVILEGLGYPVMFVPTIKTPSGDFVVDGLWRPLLAGKGLLGVEDVTTTGGSFSKVRRFLTTQFGEECAHFVGGGALWNRKGVTAQMFGGVPEFFALINERIDSCPPEECELCKQNVPLTGKSAR